MRIIVLAALPIYILSALCRLIPLRSQILPRSRPNAGDGEAFCEGGTRFFCGVIHHSKTSMARISLGYGNLFEIWGIEPLRVNQGARSGKQMVII